MIHNYDDFIRELHAAGFSQFGLGKSNVATVFLHSWNEQPEDSPVRWFSGDPDRDPWEWRARVVNERDDIAYAKFFLRRAGFITREWYPYFLAVRRKGRDFAEAYADGLYSRAALHIHECLEQNGALPVHDLKPMAGFGRTGLGPGDKAAFERGLADLQMGLYITVCGHAQKVSRVGEPYGWSSDVYCCTAEEFMPEEAEAAALLEPAEAAEAIEAQVYRLNPEAEAKAVRKFIYG